ncbi:helicase HerA domain-containing protein, partial [Pyrococcus kukulkanii]
MSEDIREIVREDIPLPVERESFQEKKPAREKRDLKQLLKELVFGPPKTKEVQKTPAGSVLEGETVSAKVSPTPFGLLEDRARDMILNNFESYLNAIEKPTIIYLKPYLVVYTIDDEEYPALVTDHYIITSEETTLQTFFRARIPPKAVVKGSILDNIRPKVKKEHPSYVELEDGRLARVFVMYALGNELPEGVIIEFLPLASEIIMIIEPINNTSAIGYMNKALTRLGSILSEREDIQLSARMLRLRLLAERIQAQIKIHKFTLLLVLTARDLGALEEKTKVLKAVAKKHNIHLDMPYYVQRKLYDLDFSVNLFLFKAKLINPIVIDSRSLSLFYPFISDDIRDPDGIFLGINPNTGSPIVYNPYAHSNYNIVILGESGSGKSMTTKVFLRRFVQKYPNAMFYVLDPEGEYAPVAKIFHPDTVVVKVR